MNLPVKCSTIIYLAVNPQKFIVPWMTLICAILQLQINTNTSKFSRYCLLNPSDYCTKSLCVLKLHFSCEHVLVINILTSLEIFYKYFRITLYKHTHTVTYKCAQCLYMHLLIYGKSHLTIFTLK